MAGPNEGFRYIIVVTTLADAPAADYDDGTIAYDSTTDTFHGLAAGAWVAFTVT
jgi:hypothetical protein